MSKQPDYVKRALAEDVDVVPYDPAWPQLFAEEKRHLRECLPQELIGRIDHFGSTAVPHLAAKPIVDVLVEVVSLDAVRKEIAPILERQGYEFFWRPTARGNTDVGYTWFIKRDANGRRTHHIHMLEKGWEYDRRLLFRDHLIRHPSVASAYAAFKRRLAAEHAHNRSAYASEKSDYIDRIIEEAKQYQEAVGQISGEHRTT